jgi:hypothetical protein
MELLNRLISSARSLFGPTTADSVLARLDKLVAALDAARLHHNKRTLDIFDTITKLEERAAVEREAASRTRRALDALRSAGLAK